MSRRKVTEAKNKRLEENQENCSDVIDHNMVGAESSCGTSWVISRDVLWIRGISLMASRQHSPRQTPEILTSGDRQVSHLQFCPRESLSECCKSLAPGLSVSEHLAPARARSERALRVSQPPCARLRSGGSCDDARPRSSARCNESCPQFARAPPPAACSSSSDGGWNCSSAAGLVLAPDPLHGSQRSPSSWTASMAASCGLPPACWCSLASDLAPLSSPWSCSSSHWHCDAQSRRLLAPGTASGIH